MTHRCFPNTLTQANSIPMTKSPPKRCMSNNTRLVTHHHHTRIQPHQDPITSPNPHIYRHLTPTFSLQTEPSSFPTRSQEPPLPDIAASFIFFNPPNHFPNDLHQQQIDVFPSWRRGRLESNPRPLRLRTRRPHRSRSRDLRPPERHRCRSTSVRHKRIEGARSGAVRVFDNPWLLHYRGTERCM